MPGRIPKDQAIRQRTNKAATRATLPAEMPTDGAEHILPTLPTHRKWYRLTQTWWEDVWRSPMAGEYLQADIHGLYILAELVNRFWRKPTTALASEIRLQRQCFGMSPIDRRRLEWQVERVEAVARKQQAPQAPIDAADDPRRFLMVVS